MESDVRAAATGSFGKDWWVKHAKKPFTNPGVGWVNQGQGGLDSVASSWNSNYLKRPTRINLRLWTLEVKRYSSR